MANPLFIPIQFAKNGIKNVIQKVLQPSQDQEDATWNSGWGQITMIPKEDGGLAPKGQDFNGILYTMSDHLVHRQNGQQILFSTDVVDEYNGYAKNSIIQSDDGLKHFRSLIDNNTFNPNTQSIANRWEIYAGAGSVPSASSTIAGVIRVINNVGSTDVGAALSAAMGKYLNDNKLGYMDNAASATKLSTAVGNAPSYSARAFAAYNGATNTLERGMNISSVVRNSVGDYTFNFTTPMPTALYAVSLSGCRTFSATAIDGNRAVYSRTTTSFRVKTQNTEDMKVDHDFLSVAVFY